MFCTMTPCAPSGLAKDTRNSSRWGPGRIGCSTTSVIGLRQLQGAGRLRTAGRAILRGRSVEKLYDLDVGEEDVAVGGDPAASPDLCGPVAACKKSDRIRLTGVTDCAHLAHARAYAVGRGKSPLPP